MFLSPTLPQLSFQFSRFRKYFPLGNTSLRKYSVGKEPTCHAGDTEDSGSIPGSGRPPGEGNDNPFHYSCLGNPMDIEAWWVKSMGLQESDVS